MINTTTKIDHTDQNSKKKKKKKKTHGTTSCYTLATTHRLKWRLDTFLNF